MLVCKGLGGCCAAARRRRAVQSGAAASMSCAVRHRLLSPRQSEVKKRPEAGASGLFHYFGLTADQAFGAAGAAISGTTSSGT